MNDALRIGKKSFTWFVVGATILWAMSAAFMVIPLTAKAVTLTAGDLIRGTEKSVYGGYPVYYYGSDGKKYLFPTANTYMTWYSDFSAVKAITQAELEAIPFGGNVTYKPGVKLVRFSGDAKVYALEKGGTLRHVSSEADAEALYGAEWWKWGVNLDVIPEGFQANYTTGTAVASASDYDKAAASAAAPDIGTDKGLAATPVGALTAALASDNPSGMVLPAGVSGVTLLKVKLSAGSSDTTVTGLTFKATGVGASDDFTNIYVYEGDTRLTSGRTLASQTKQVEYSNLSISVPANGTKTLSLVGDVATGIAAAPPTSGDTHAFSLVAIGTSASVSGLPLAGDTFSIGSQDVSTVTVQRGADPASPTIGQTNMPVGEFRLTAGTNDVELRRVTVTVGGTVSVSDLSNFELYQGSTKLGVGTVSGDRVTFVLDTAYTIGQGATRIFTLKADVAGRGGRKITAYIDSSYPSDLYVVDKVYGMGTGFTWTSFATACTAAATPANCGSYVETIGGRVTVAFNGPAASDVSKGTQDVTLYKFAMTAGDQAVEVKRLGVTIAGTAGGFVRGSVDTKYFTDIKIKNLDTGTVLMGPKEHTAALSATTTGGAPCAGATALCYTDAWTLNAGQTVNLVVTADLANAEDAGADEYFGEPYAVTLEAFSATSIREISTGQYLAVADIVGGGTAVTGNTMTVRESSLTVSGSSTPASGTTVKGTQNVQMVGFSFTAGASSAVKVTQLVLAGEGDSDAGAPDFTGAGDNALVNDLVISASLWDGSTQIGTVKSPSSTGTLTFDNLNWNLAAGETKKLIAKVNVATTLISGTDDKVYLGLPVANVTAQDTDGNSVTAAAGTTDPINTDGAFNFLTINNVGTLTVAIDGDTPLSTLVVSSASNVAMTKVRFTAANEAFLVKKVRVVNTSGGASDNDGGSDDMITAVKLSYKKQDGSTGTVSGSLIGGAADISFPTGAEFYIASSVTEVLTISADIVNLNEASGRVAVETPRFGLDFGEPDAVTTHFEAVGVGSSNTLDDCDEITAGTGVVCDDGDLDADVVGNLIRVVKTKPTVTLAAGSPSGAGVPGLNEVLRFTVAADASGDMVLDTLTFKVTGTCNSGDGDCTDTTDWMNLDTSTGSPQPIVGVAGWSIYDAADLTTQKDTDGGWTLYATDGTTLTGDEVIGWARQVFATPINIAAGTSKTFVLKVDTTGASSASDDTVRFDIQEETATIAGNEFQWDEQSSNAVVDIAGTLVKNLPVTGGTIVY